jgi:Carboxypeptidase regulatory-like domain
MKNNDFLREMRIATPCPVGWDQMTGDERVRHCRLCDLHVYNFSDMTRKEAQSLIEQSSGRICARLFRRADGTVITRDCPVGLRAVRRRVAKTATAVFTAVLSFSAMVFGQKPSQNDKHACVPQVQITRKLSGTQKSGSVVLQILDVNGAAVAGADVVLIESDWETDGSAKPFANMTNEEGRVEFSALRKGSYDLRIQQPGFTDFVMRKVSVASNELVSMTITLTISVPPATVGVLDLPLMLPNKPIGTTTITREMLDRLPF